MTKVPLFSELKNDTRWRRNFLRVIGFLLLFIVLDLVLSVFLLKGIERFYGLKSNADVLMIGHSHLMLAVDKELLERAADLRWQNTPGRVLIWLTVVSWRSNISVHAPQNPKSLSSALTRGYSQVRD